MRNHLDDSTLASAAIADACRLMSAPCATSGSNGGRQATVN